MAKKVIEDQNKPWQHGYSLDYLKALEERFSAYNETVRSPFGAFKKNRIAQALADKELFAMFGDGHIERAEPAKEPQNKAVALFTFATSKVKSEITMYPEVVIGIKAKGDVTIQFVSVMPGYEKQFAKMLAGFKDAQWIYLLEEFRPHKDIANALTEIKGDFDQYTRMGIKINTHADIFSIYFKDEHPNLVELMAGFQTRMHPFVSPFESFALEPCILPKTFEKNLKATIKRVEDMTRTFTDHYSNYNRDHAWGALSLRGYSKDPTFITKPSEMNDKWNEEHKDEVFEMQDTPMAKEFPEAMQIARAFAGSGKIHRVRLMRLKPGGGELERHTDQVDKDSGIADGKVMRIHVPIKTNRKVVFTLWGVDAKPKAMHFAVGTAFYLDTRKPHTAVNGGDEERIHLVMDIEATDHLRDFLDVNL